MGRLAAALPVDPRLDDDRRFHRADEFDLPVECTYDFEVAGAKYLHALADGDIPLLLLFSGTVFTRGNRASQAEPLSWIARPPTGCRWRSGGRSWTIYFPNSGWIRVGRDTLDELQRFQAVRGPAHLGPGLRAMLLKQAGADTP